MRQISYRKQYETKNGTPVTYEQGEFELAYRKPAEKITMLWARW
jgi:hypothetical protein